MRLTGKGTLRGAKRLLPIAVFVIPFGIAFGVAAVERDLTALQAILMSTVVFSGAAQFAALELWVHPIPLVSLALVALAVNARHIVMGAVLSPWLNELSAGKRFTVLAYLSDPNFADSQPAFRSGENDVGILLGGGLILWLHWIAGTALGALAGRLIGDLKAFGFDVVMVCFFAAVVAGQLRNRSVIAPVVVGSTVAVLTLNWLPSGWNIIAGAVAGGLSGVAIDAD